MAEELKKDAKGTDSSSVDNGAKGAGSPPAEELIAENKRKAEKIAKLEADYSDAQERLSQLEEKERTRELTAKEEREKRELSSDVKTEAQKLRTLKETQPWIEVAKEEAEKAGTEKAFEVMLNNELERANDMIDDLAEEMGKTPKELAKELQPFALKYQDKRPSRRNELAIRDLKKAQSKSKSLEEREKAIRQREDDEKKFREGVGRHVRDSSLDQKLETAESAKDKMRIMRDMVETGVE